MSSFYVLFVALEQRITCKINSLGTVAILSFVVLRATTAKRHKQHVNRDHPVKQQKELRRMHDGGEHSISDLAEMFSVSRPTICRTLSRVQVA